MGSGHLEGVDVDDDSGDDDDAWIQIFQLYKNTS